MPGLQVKEFFHRDGTRFISIARGSWAWIKIRPEEITGLINDLADITENMENTK